MKQRKRTQWLKLDNAAKIFPATSGKRDTKVFRIACELTEPIDETMLNQALELTVGEFPVFQSVLRKGLFWYYFETVHQKLKVHKEDAPPCSPMYDENRKTFLFHVSYYNQRINLEVHHVLTDGVGAKMFLTTLVCNYLKIAHSEELKDVEFAIGNDDASIEERLDDSFSRYYDNKEKESIEGDKEKRPKTAYRLHGPKLSENRIKVVEGHIPVHEIKQCAKEQNASVTVYLTALIISAIGEAMTVREKRKPVGIMVPVNLRSYFKSSSIRNFFATINVVYDFSKESGEFKDILTKVEQCFKEELTEEKMRRNLNHNGALGNNPFTRFVPLAIKDFFIRIAYHLSDRQYTFSVSNIGIFTMPKEMESYIQSFSVFVSTKKKQACVCSFKDRLVIGFTSPLISTEVERNVFRKLTALGIDVEIAATSGWED